MRILASLLLLSSLNLAACHSSTPAGTSTATQPAAFQPAGSYSTGGGCAAGTPENPTCTQQLELAVDGTGSFIGDDIVEQLTWSVDGDRVVVKLASRSFELRRGPDGTLTGEHGVWSPKQP